MSTITLYRAADTDTWGDCAAFAETREAAEAYLDNPGYGGARLWSCEVQPRNVLDLTGEDDATAAIAERIGAAHPGAIGADEYAPRVSYELRDAGVEWVRVRESYPEDSITWIYVGSDDPELEEL